MINSHYPLRTIIIIAIVVFAAVLPLLAQPVYKNNLPLDIGFRAQPELYLEGSQRLFASIELRFRQENTTRIGDGPLGSTEFRMGYEKWLRGVWGIGGAFQRQRLPNEQINIWQGYGIHNGKIGEQWIFVKQFQVNYYNYRISLRDANFLLEGKAYLGRRVEVLNRPWQLGLSYTVMKNTNTPEESRRFSQTDLVFQVDFPVGKRVVCKVFFNKNSQYYFGLAQERYDAAGNLIGSIPYHKLNRITPTIGLSCRFLLNGNLADKRLPFVFIESAD